MRNIWQRRAGALALITLRARLRNCDPLRSAHSRCWQLARTRDQHERLSDRRRISSVARVFGDFADADSGRVTEHRGMRVFGEVALEVACGNCESPYGVEHLLRIDPGIEVVFYRMSISSAQEITGSRGQRWGKRTTYSRLCVSYCRIRHLIGAIMAEITYLSIFMGCATPSLENPTHQAINSSQKTSVLSLFMGDLRGLVIRLNPTPSFQKVLFQNEMSRERFSVFECSFSTLGDDWDTFETAMVEPASIRTQKESV